MTDTKILVGDARDRLRELPDKSVHCVITSPPYWGLRSYKGDCEQRYLPLATLVFKNIYKCHSVENGLPVLMNNGIFHAVFAYSD